VELREVGVSLRSGRSQADARFTGDMLRRKPLHNQMCLDSLRNGSLLRNTSNSKILCVYRVTVKHRSGVEETRKVNQYSYGKMILLRVRFDFGLIFLFPKFSTYFPDPSSFPPSSTSLLCLFGYSVIGISHAMDNILTTVIRYDPTLVPVPPARAPEGV